MTKRVGGAERDRSLSIARLGKTGRAVSPPLELGNSKTLFDKDCSLGSVKNLTTSPCQATDE